MVCNQITLFAYFIPLNLIPPGAQTAQTEELTMESLWFLQSLKSAECFRGLFQLSCSIDIIMSLRDRVAEVAQGREGPSPKSLDSDENFNP